MAFRQRKLSVTTQWREYQPNVGMLADSIILSASTKSINMAHKEKKGNKLDALNCCTRVDIHVEIHFFFLAIFLVRESYLIIIGISVKRIKIKTINE